MRLKRLLKYTEKDDSSKNGKFENRFFKLAPKTVNSFPLQCKSAKCTLQTLRELLAKWKE